MVTAATKRDIKHSTNMEIGIAWRLGDMAWLLAPKDQTFVLSLLKQFDSGSLSEKQWYWVGVKLAVANRLAVEKGYAEIYTDPKDGTQRYDIKKEVPGLPNVKGLKKMQKPPAEADVKPEALSIVPDPKWADQISDEELKAVYGDYVGAAAKKGLIGEFGLDLGSADKTAVGFFHKGGMLTKEDLAALKDKGAKIKFLEPGVDHGIQFIPLHSKSQLLAASYGMGDAKVLGLKEHKNVLFHGHPYKQFLKEYTEGYATGNDGFAHYLSGNAYNLNAGMEANGLPLSVEIEKDIAYQKYVMIWKGPAWALTILDPVVMNWATQVNSATTFSAFTTALMKALTDAAMAQKGLDGVDYGLLFGTKTFAGIKLHSTGPNIQQLPKKKAGYDVPQYHMDPNYLPGGKHFNYPAQQGYPVQIHKNYVEHNILGKPTPHVMVTDVSGEFEFDLDLEPYNSGVYSVLQDMVMEVHDVLSKMKSGDKWVTFDAHPYTGSHQNTIKFEVKGDPETVEVISKLAYMHFAKGDVSIMKVFPSALFTWMKEAGLLKATAKSYTMAPPPPVHVNVVGQPPHKLPAPTIGAIAKAMQEAAKGGSKLADAFKGLGKTLTASVTLDYSDLLFPKQAPSAAEIAKMDEINEELKALAKEFHSAPGKPSHTLTMKTPIGPKSLVEIKHLLHKLDWPGGKKPTIAQIITMVQMMSAMPPEKYEEPLTWYGEPLDDNTNKALWQLAGEYMASKGTPLPNAAKKLSS